MSYALIRKLMVLSVMLGAAGLFLLFGSVNFGTLLAENWLSNQVDGVDTYLYEIRMKGNINNFLAVGSILFTIGLASISFLYYKCLSMKGS